MTDAIDEVQTLIHEAEKQGYDTEDIRIGAGRRAYEEVEDQMHVHARIEESESAFGGGLQVLGVHLTEADIAPWEMTVTDGVDAIATTDLLPPLPAEGPDGPRPSAEVGARKLHANLDYYDVVQATVRLTTERATIEEPIASTQDRSDGMDSCHAEVTLESGRWLQYNLSPEPGDYARVVAEVDTTALQTVETLEVVTDG
jgi:hypothetical protein